MAPSEDLAADTSPAEIAYTLADRLEASKLHRRCVAPRGEGWSAHMRALLRIDDIAPKTSFSRQRRRTGKGRAAKIVSAKLCSRGFMPFLLPAHAARGTAGAAQLDQWTHLALDLDKVGMAVEALLDVTQVAFGHLRHVSWTTWSCQDGKASARVLLPLSRSATYSEVCSLWWWAWDQLVKAGLPSEGHDGKEPSLDPRLDAKAYFLPAMPESGVPGEEDWGGVEPRGYVSEDDEPLLDVEAVLPLGRAVEAAERESFAARWENIPLPGGRGRTGGKVSTRSSTSKAGLSNAEKSAAVRVDFTTIPFEGTTLRAWADAHLAPGSWRNVDTPWREDECWGARGTALSLHVEEDGRVWAKDFRSGIAYIDVSGTFEGVVYAPKKTPPGATSTTFDDPPALHRDDVGRLVVSLDERDLTPEGWASFDVIRDVITRDAEHLAAEPSACSTIVLEVGQGRGKTELAAKFCATTLAKGGRVVAVAPTRSLVSDCARRFGLPDYRAVGEGYIRDSVAVCLPSLPRVINFSLPDGEGEAFTFKVRGPDLLVLDEIEQQVATLASDHLLDSDARKAWAALVECVRLAKRVLLLDANAGPLTRHLLQVAGRDPSTTLWVRAPGAAPRRLEVIKRADLWRSQLLAACLTGRQATACHSCAEAESLAKLAPLWDGLPNLVLTADSILKHGIDVSNLDRDLPQYGHLFFSPAIGTGVSIALKNHFERVWGILCDSVGTATSALQLLSRVRHPVDRSISIARLGGGRTPSFWEKDATKVEARWWRGETLTLRKVGFERDLPPAEIEVVGDGHEVSKTVRAYTSAMALAHASQVRAGLGQVTDALSVYCSRLGWEVVEVTGDEVSDEEKAVRVAIQEAKAEVKAAEVTSIVQADDLPEADLDRVRRKGAKTYSEALGVRRASIERVYGPGTADDEAVVAFDDRGRGRKAIYGYGQVAAAIEGGEALTSLERLDRAQLRKNGSPLRLRHRTVKASSLASLVKRLVGATACGQIFAIDTAADPSSPKDVPTSPVSIDEVAASKIAELFTSELGRELAPILGVSVGDANHSPMRFAGRILEAAGLSMTSRKVQVNGERHRVYEIDLEALAQVQDLSAHYLGGLRSGDLGDLDEDEGERERASKKTTQAQAEVVDLAAARAFDERLQRQARLLDEACEELYAS